jgi:hypothetical protein
MDFAFNDPARPLSPDCQTTYDSRQHAAMAHSFVVKTLKDELAGDTGEEPPMVGK